MNARPGPYPTAFAIRSLGLAALWWVLTEGEAWAVGSLLALLIAGISLLGPMYRFTEDLIEPYSILLREASRKISLKLSQFEGHEAGRLNTASSNQ